VQQQPQELPGQLQSNMQRMLTLKEVEDEVVFSHLIQLSKLGVLWLAVSQFLTSFSHHGVDWEGIDPNRIWTSINLRITNRADTSLVFQVIRVHMQLDQFN
jgi:hypothetical protein